MDSNQTLESLRRCKDALAEQFGVRSLALFGSAARVEASQTSDVDVLISFNGEANAKRYFGALFYLEDELGATVDLVTETALRNELKPYVERDLIYV